MKIVTAGSCVFLIALMMHGQTLDAAASCESLSSMMLPNTPITVAQRLPPGGFTPPGTGPGAVPQFSRLPAFCRIAATLTPSSDSDIKIEVWLPAASGMGNSRPSAMVAGRARSAMARWPQPYRRGTRRHRRIRDTRAEMRRSQSDIRKESSISRIEPSTRWQ